ncbi:MAG: tyrosine-type recombinase/integrase [Salinisphaera sp.]|uniref:tyrosine-type recombinase/integrase n=1 Tax=Salinisphaera sp. TaxID=1914330 RepID=UPI003C7D0C85
MENQGARQRNRFSKAAKMAAKPGQDILDNGVVWRKRSDGSGSWRYDIKVNGQRHKGTIGAEKDGVTLSQARTHVLHLRSRSISDGLDKQVGRSTEHKRRFTEAAHEFLRWSQHHHRDFEHNCGRMKKHLLPAFGNETLGSITPAAIEEFRSQLLASELSRETIRRIISLLSSVFEYARKTDPNLENPTRKLSHMKTQSKPIEVFSYAETDALLAEGAQNLVEKLIVALALYAGLRASEVLGLNWKNIDLDKKRITICQTARQGKLFSMTKGFDWRIVPITSALRPLLIDYRASVSDDGLLFSSDGITPYYQVQHIFTRIKTRTGISTGVTYHGLRHSFATRAAERDIPLPVIQKWLGHSDITTTMRYIHAKADYMDQLASKLD